RQELESENKKLKQDLSELRKSLTSENSDMAPPAPGSLPYNILLEQLSSSNEELEMRKEEVLLLRSHMVRQEALKHRGSVLGEGVKLDLGEIHSFQDPDSTIHTSSRLLETQMQEQECLHSEKYRKLEEEMNKLRTEKEQQQKLLAQSLLLPEDARVEASLKHEITRLTTENLERMEQQENQDKTIRNAHQIIGSSVTSTPVRPVHITRKEKEFQGMLEFKEGDTSHLKPRGVAVSFTPGLPAFIIFMCLRYADNVNDDRRLSTLLNSTISSIKGVIKKKGNDFEVVSFWLANTCRLMHCLKQYSGDEGVLGSKPTGLRKRSSSSPEEAVTVEVLLQHLSFFHTTISQHGMDSDIIKQVVRQQFYIISAVTLNNLLLRKDMCSWGKGLQIRDESSSLMMDAKKIFSVTFPFTPSSVALETIQIPTSLNLGFLIRV
ncbi:hypothetical protein GOODEAATRI_020089, partial [Goodea atripinnis]